VSRATALARRERLVRGRDEFSVDEASFILTLIRIGALFECWAADPRTVTIGMLVDACAEIRDPYALPGNV